MKVAGETVRLGEQYLARADETLTAAIQTLSPEPSTSTTSSVSFADLGPDLDALLSGIQSEMKANQALDKEEKVEDAEETVEPCEPSVPPSSDDVDNVDVSVWTFLQES